MTVRFGLLGAGRIGKVHAKAVSGDANAKLVAVPMRFRPPPKRFPPPTAARSGPSKRSSRQ